MNLIISTIVALTLAPGGADLRDVPAGHWASSAVTNVVSRGILAAPDGRFDGDRAVTRRELTHALAQFAKSLIARKWPSTNSTKALAPVKGPARTSITRYELAATLARLGPIIAAGLPAAGPKSFYGSESFPRSAKVKAPTTEPAYASAQYLAKEHMAFGDSVTLSPSTKPVTPAELKKAVAMVIVGMVDRLTDEPQNREMIEHPPTRK